MESFTPHAYQQAAIDFIEQHEIAALFLDMGLGKTVITLTAINTLITDSFQARKVLVIAPLRVARDTWPAEIKKWEHLQELRYSVAVGTEAERERALRAKADIYIINRENVQWLIEKSERKFDFDTVVIDELSSFKSAQGKRFKSLMLMRPRVKRIIGLTGTPASNGLMDLFAEFKLLDQGVRLGRFITHYRDRYFKPDKRNGAIIYSYKLKPGAEEEIYEKIGDITISMKAKDHLQMPDYISTEYPVELSASERKAYNELAQTMVLQFEADEITAANAATLQGQLSQLANGAIYNEEKDYIEVHQAKLDALEDLIEAANGQPLLVAYWFKHDLARIKKRFGVREIKTSKDIEDWNQKKIPVAVIHPASAGHGLNIQHGGNKLVWFGLSWSLELYQQTNARLWRQGQEESSVTIQHIITKNTVDEDIMRALARKDTTQKALIEAVKARIGGYKRK